MKSWMWHHNHEQLKSVCPFYLWSVWMRTECERYHPKPFPAFSKFFKDFCVFKCVTSQPRRIKSGLFLQLFCPMDCMDEGAVQEQYISNIFQCLHATSKIWNFCALVFVTSQPCNTQNSLYLQFTYLLVCVDKGLRGSSTIVNLFCI